MGITHCSRTLMYGPHVTFCSTEAAFKKEMKRLNVTNPSINWIKPGADASTHILESEKYGLITIVCMPIVDRDPVSVAALLCHEAVHIWQAYCEAIGEMQPGVEQEAYSIQALAQELMEAYRDHLEKFDR